MEPQTVRYRMPSHPRLGRNVNHDPASKTFRVARAGQVSLAAVRHESSLPILDQGQIGACTGMSGVAAIYRRPFFTGGVVKPWKYAPNVGGAFALYSQATQTDPYAGAWSYPPPPGTGQDTGSDGLTIAKVLKREGIISGYLWAFTLREAVETLMKTPVITGVPWFQSMFDVTSDGHPGHVVIKPESGSAGGHELCVDELVPVGGEDRWEDWFVGGPNSWGTSYGDGGRWYWTVREWGRLLAMQGDVTAFVARDLPAPDPMTPTPEPAPDAERAAGDELWGKVREWSGRPHLFSNERAAKAVRAWAKATGRS